MSPELSLGFVVVDGGAVVVVVVDGVVCVVDVGVVVEDDCGCTTVKLVLDSEDHSNPEL